MASQKKCQNPYEIELPQSIIDSFARFLAPEIRKLYASEEGQKELEEWKKVSVKYEYEKTSHASVKAWLVFQNQIFIYVERQRSGACAGNKAVAQSSPLDASIGALVRTHVR